VLLWCLVNVLMVVVEFMYDIGMMLLVILVLIRLFYVFLICVIVVMLVME